MDFTEAAEYKFLCPSLMIGLRGRKGEVKVDDEVRHWSDKKSRKVKEILIGSSVEISRRCCHQSSIDCRPKLRSTEELSSNCVPVEVSTDSVILSDESIHLRSLMYNAEEMITSSPEFEPTFHLEDIDLSHSEVPSVDQFILNAAAIHLLGSVPVKSQNISLSKYSKHLRLRGVMSTGSLHLPRNIQAGVTQTERKLDPRAHGIGTGAPADPNNPNGLDVPTIQFDPNRAIQCGATANSESPLDQTSEAGVHSPLFKFSRNNDPLPSSDICASKRTPKSSLTAGLLHLRSMASDYGEDTFDFDLGSELLQSSRSRLEHHIQFKLSAFSGGRESHDLSGDSVIGSLSDSDFLHHEKRMKSEESSRKISLRIILPERYRSEWQILELEPFTTAREVVYIALRLLLPTTLGRSPDQFEILEHSEHYELHKFDSDDTVISLDATVGEIGCLSVALCPKPATEMNDMTDDKFINFENEESIRSDHPQLPSSKMSRDVNWAVPESPPASDSNIVGSLAFNDSGNVTGVAIGKQGLPFEVNQAPIEDFSPEDSPCRNELQSLLSFLPERIPFSVRVQPVTSKGPPERRRHTISSVNTTRCESPKKNSQPDEIRSFDVPHNFERLPGDSLARPTRPDCVVGKRWNFCGPVKSSIPRRLTTPPRSLAIEENKSEDDTSKEEPLREERTQSLFVHKNRLKRDIESQDYSVQMRRRNSSREAFGQPRQTEVSTVVQSSIMTRISRIHKNGPGQQILSKREKSDVLAMRLFVIMSPRAASEVNPSIDIESSNVVRVISQLIELGQVRQDIELLKVPEDSRVFELLSCLAKTQNAHILGKHCPNPGMLFFESFFSGQRIETDILVNTLTKQDSCLVLMRKTANTRSSRTHSASIPDPKDSRPLPDVFEFIDYRTSTFPMTYRCSVAVISVGGVAVPPDKYRFHTCQVVVDSLRLYHSFLHATPWDSSSSSEDDDLLAPLTESEELDRLYIATKNERIKLFTSPSEQKFAPNSKSSNCQERNNSVPNSFLNLVEDSVQETSLEDLFIPVHVSFTDVSSVEPNPANASQLDVAYSMPRRLEALGAVPEEEEENILHFTLPFEHPRNSHSFRTEGVKPLSSIQFEDRLINPATVSSRPRILLPHGSLSPTRRPTTNDLWNRQSRSTLINVRVTYVAESPHMCAELIARLRFLANLRH